MLTITDKHLCCILLAPLLGTAASGPSDAADAVRLDVDYHLQNDAHSVQDQIFYFLTLLSKLPGPADVVHDHPRLQALHQQRLQAVRHALESCKTQAAFCWFRPFLLRQQEVDDVKRIMASLDDQKTLIRHMRRSGFFIGYSGLSDQALLGRAWQDVANALNRIIAVYGLGDSPRYPETDSMTLDLTSKGNISLLRDLLAVMIEEQEQGLFFSLSLNMALTLLELNEREDAGRFLPLERGHNQLSWKAARNVQWSEWAWSAILVPGDAPERSGQLVGSHGRLRLRLAANRFSDGMAPFIVVSGGNVRPHTALNEALEMKKELIRRYQVPEQAIIVEPHARHTTTNLRNAVRLMYRYRFPLDKPALITTSSAQSAYIESDQFRARCMEELGYLPVQLLERLSPFDVVFMPRITALHRDARDPLDP